VRLETFTQLSEIAGSIAAILVLLITVILARDALMLWIRETFKNTAFRIIAAGTATILFFLGLDVAVYFGGRWEFYRNASSDPYYRMFETGVWAALFLYINLRWIEASVRRLRRNIRHLNAARIDKIKAAKIMDNLYHQVVADRNSAKSLTRSSARRVVVESTDTTEFARLIKASQQEGFVQEGATETSATSSGKTYRARMIKG
jgi:hypothetical protein